MLVAHKGTKGEGSAHPKAGRFLAENRVDTGSNESVFTAVNYDANYASWAWVEDTLAFWLEPEPTPAATLKKVNFLIKIARWWKFAKKNFVKNIVYTFHLNLKI